jgi:hypothetical protein
LQAVNHPPLLHTSILEVYEVIENLHMQLMGIWVHPSTVILIQVGVKFGKQRIRGVDGHMGAPFNSYTHPGGCPNFGKPRVRRSPNNSLVSCLQAVNHPTLLHTSILEVYEVLRCLRTFIVCSG